MTRQLVLRRLLGFDGQEGRHAAQHCRQLTKKHIRAHTHIHLDRTHTQESKIQDVVLKTIRMTNTKCRVRIRLINVPDINILIL